MADINQGYASKSTAIRGAKRAGIENPTAEQKEDGKWYIVTVPEQNDPTPNEELVEATPVVHKPVLSEATSKKADETIAMSRETIARLAAKFPKPVESTPEEIEARRAERREKVGIPAPVKTEKAPSYKEMARSGPEKSEIKKPVQVIHEYLAEHYGKRSRKELIAELVAMGINVATCRTQYQHFKRKAEEGEAAK